VLLFCGFALAIAKAQSWSESDGLTRKRRPDGQGGRLRDCRHPMYSGAILAAFGWGLWVHGVLTSAMPDCCFFFDLKSRREELWLGEKFHSRQLSRARAQLLPLVY